MLAATDAPLAPCLFDAEWHPGVVGLVASKMKERLHRPALAFAPPSRAAAAARFGALDPRLPYPRCAGGVDARHPGPDPALRRPRDGGRPEPGAVDLPRSIRPSSMSRRCSTRPAAGRTAQRWRAGGRRVRSPPMPRRCATAGRGGRDSPSRCSTASSRCWTGAWLASATSSWTCASWPARAAQRDPLWWLDGQPPPTHAHRVSPGAGRLPRRRMRSS